MAGIGFELKNLLKKNTFVSSIQAYTYAGLISAGPWVLSIIAIIILGLLSLGQTSSRQEVVQFQTSVTSLIAGSLLATSFLQMAFTRFIADELFEDRSTAVIPNLNGALLVCSLLTGVMGALVIGFFFHGESLVYYLLMEIAFVILSNIWITTFLLSGLKAYTKILVTFAIGYGITLLLGLLLYDYGLIGLLSSFCLGQLLLLLGMLLSVHKEYPSDAYISLDFLKPGRMHRALIFTGIFYNFGIWVDKILFWYHPTTGTEIIAGLHASLLYDLPIFLAYMTILPGMAVFLVRIETDFAEYYESFFSAIREGGSLNEINAFYNELVLTARQSLFEIMKIQTLTVFIVFAIGPLLLKLLGLNELYLPLFYVDTIAASLQIILLVVLNILFYLDKRKRTMMVTLCFFITNALLSWLSIQLGPYYYGYGFATALLITVSLSFIMLDKDFELLEYETFMMQQP